MNRYTLLFSIYLTLVACGPSSDELSPEEKYTLDTIFQRNQAKFKLTADSLCTIHRDSIYKLVVDSLKAEYKEEINSLMGKTEEGK